MLELGGLVLDLGILTFYVGTWRRGLKLRIEVEHIDGLCWDLAVRFEAAERS